jgi:hypothetical protein
MSEIKDQVHMILTDPLKSGLLHEQAIAEIEAEIVSLFVVNFNELRDHYDPACKKCGVRKSKVMESQKQNEIYIQCIPMGREAWMGNERHQFAQDKKKYLKV